CVPGLVAMVKFMDEHGMASAALKAVDWKAHNLNLLDQARVDALSREFGAFFLTKTAAELYRAACERDLMLAPINTPPEITASRQLGAREFIVEVEHPGRGRLRHPGNWAITAEANTSTTHVGIRRPAPRLGEHTTELLRELGLGAADVERLRAEGVV